MATRKDTERQARRAPMTVSQIERRVGDAEPAPIRANYVVVNGRRYPPSQVMGLLLGRRARGVRSATAQRRLQRLGLVGGHVEQRDWGREEPAPTGVAHSRSSPSADARTAFEDELRAHAGEWVATRGDRLLTAAPEARTVVAWLSEHDERADTMYRVPRTLAEVSGSAA